MAGRKKVSEYECKRSFDRTPEPRGRKRKKAAKGNRFVIQEHHARRLHWDLRLEHDGTLVSFALPRGVPQDPKQNRLAVHTEDHPLEYLELEGDITPTYPELRPLAAELGSRDAVLDGEIVAFDDEGNPSFERLQGRMNLASDAAVRRRMGDCPVTYLVFDVLYLEGRTLMDLPYT